MAAINTNPPFKVPVSHFVRGLAITALLAASASASQFTHPFDNAAHENAFRLMLISFGIVWTALWLARSWIPDDVVMPAPNTQSTALQRDTSATLRWHRTKRFALVLGLALLALLAEINGQLLKLDILQHVSHHIQFVMWVAGIALFVWGLLPSVAEHPQPTQAEKYERAFLLVLMLVALGLRLWNIGDGMRVFVDEAHFADPVRAFWMQDNVKILQPFSSIAAFPYLYPYLQAATVDVFGRGLTGLRIPSAFFGALTIPALYMLAKQLFDRPTALIAALLLTVFPPHLQFSRIGLNNIADPLFGVLAFGLLVRGVRRGHPRDFVLAGLSMGLTQYFYEGGRFVFPGLAAIWLVWLLFTRWKPLSPTVRRGMATFLLTTVVVGFPIYYTLAGLGRPVAQRIATASMPTHFWTDGLTQPSQVMERFIGKIQENALLLTTHTEGELYYHGDVPLIMPMMVVALILGLAIILWRWRTAGGFLLIVWIAAPIITLSLLMSHTANAARLAVLFPALVLVMAVGIRQIVMLIFRGQPRLEILTLLVVTIGCTAMQGVYYFGTHIPVFMEVHYIEEPAQEAVFQAATLPPNTVAHIVEEQPFSLFVAQSMIHFLADGVQIFVYTPEMLTDETLRTLSNEVNHAFYVRWLDETSKARIASHFPIDPDSPLAEGNQWTIRNPYVLYFVPASPTPDSEGGR